MLLSWSKKHNEVCHRILAKTVICKGVNYSKPGTISDEKYQEFIADSITPPPHPPPPMNNTELKQKTQGTMLLSV
jgi:hypothetical protein